MPGSEPGQRRLNHGDPRRLGDGGEDGLAKPLDQPRQRPLSRREHFPS
jgi:hypothetical protein